MFKKKKKKMILEILCAVLAVLCLVLWKLVRGPSLSGDVLLGRHTAFVKNNGQVRKKLIRVASLTYNLAVCCFSE